MFIGFLGIGVTIAMVMDSPSFYIMSIISKFIQSLYDEIWMIRHELHNLHNVYAKLEKNLYDRLQVNHKSFLRAPIFQKKLIFTLSLFSLKVFYDKKKNILNLR